MPTNIEIKAKCSNLNHVRNILRSRGAEFKGIDYQTDTYFKTNHGRLKLREGNIENVLIYYNREDKEEPKQSDVILFKTKPETKLKEILEKSLDILTVVNKEREIYFIGNIKFHIDKVKNLGDFIEIEAIKEKEEISKDKLLKQCKIYMGLFGVKKEDLIKNSYSDLLLKLK